MRTYCRTIQLIAMAIISSLRRCLTFKARWSDRLGPNDRALVRASPETPVITLSLFSFSPTLPIFSSSIAH